MSIKTWWKDHWSDHPSTSRWAMLQIVSTFALSFLILWLGDRNMTWALPIAITLWVICIIMALRWFVTGSKDATASKADIQEVVKAINALTEEIRADRAERRRHEPRDDGNLE